MQQIRSLPQFCLAVALAGPVLLAQSAEDQPPVTEPVEIQVGAVDAFPQLDKFKKPLQIAYSAADPGFAYVVEQGGLIYRVARDGKTKTKDLFFDWSGAVLTDNWEEGLLGVAFDPGYPDKSFIYCYWSEKTGEHEGKRRGKTVMIAERRSVISRFEVAQPSSDSATPKVDASTELRIFELEQPFGNHNGGTVVFGPDKMLYVALGDGGAANDPYGNGQKLDTLLATVLRIDVRDASKDKPYSIPEDNPFVGQDGARGEIWAYGLRNPWRIAFDTATGDLWCGDVGQDRIEEVDLIVRGGNYGWNFREGDDEFGRRRQKGEEPKGLVPPIATYAHSVGISVTGGHVYRGKAIPGLAGYYVYGDFQTMRMFGVHAASGKAALLTKDPENEMPEPLELGRAPGLLSSFSEDPEGELLMACYTGKIYRLVKSEE